MWCVDILYNELMLISHFSFMVIKCYALRDLVPFVKFKKREKHLWREYISVFSPNAGKHGQNNSEKPATLLKVTFLHGCFSPLKL